MSNSNSLEKISGVIERITYHNEENGFFVIRIKAPKHYKLVTVTGSSLQIHEGERIEAFGQWVHDIKYGQQFKADRTITAAPTTIAGIEKYLSSGMIKRIGPFFAKKLIQHFGERVFDIIENDPSQLLRIEGVGVKRQQSIINNFNEQKHIREIMVFLQSYGIGTARAVRIYKIYGNNAVKKIRKNPYVLVNDIHGIGFKTADALAQSMGIQKNSIERARAGICYVLQKESKEGGHCYVDKPTLLKKSVEILDIPEKNLELAISEEIAAGNIFKESSPTIDGNQNNNRDLIYLTVLHAAELSVARDLIRLKTCGINRWGITDIPAAINWVEQKANLKFAPSQRVALEGALRNNVSIITGGPGVGKTTVINSLVKLAKIKKLKIVLCAPTGRAAKRLFEVTNTTSKTIHRLLKFDPRAGTFMYNAKNTLNIDLMIVDEISMIDILLMKNLLQAIPDQAMLILVGDIDQLPSVGPGNVACDIINSDTFVTYTLNEIHRQSGSNSKIIENAHKINNGIYPISKIKDKNNCIALTLEDFALELAGDNKKIDFYFLQCEKDEIKENVISTVSEIIPANFSHLGLNSIYDIQILAPMHKSETGTISLNAAVQEKINYRTKSNAQLNVNRFGCTFSVGDKIIQNVNNYEKDVFNGDIGKIISIDKEEGTLQVNFDGQCVEYEFNDLDEISLAYAISVHKSQGSEYPAVVIPISTQHYIMLARNLIYTAITRAKKLVIIIGEPKAFWLAVKNAETRVRASSLCDRLKSLLS